mmetsp:Transcript_22663/g.60767  ORF Transcript_22663/g.60767 Transcript_22663/m.60767 type:complete len:211 (-) Transcript_22663:540-1172(-)
MITCARARMFARLHRSTMRFPHIDVPHGTSWGRTIINQDDCCLLGWSNTTHTRGGTRAKAVAQDRLGVMPEMMLPDGGTATLPHVRRWQSGVHAAVCEYVLRACPQDRPIATRGCSRRPVLAFADSRHQQLAAVCGRHAAEVLALKTTGVALRPRRAWTWAPHVRSAPRWGARSAAGRPETQVCTAPPCRGPASSAACGRPPQSFSSLPS